MADADPALYGLVEEWLAEHGCRVAHGHSGEDAARGGFDLIVVDVPFPRERGHEVLNRLALEHPGTPIIALSSGFFSGVDQGGALARRLGVARVLPKPVTRAALLAAVHGSLVPPA